MSLIVSVFINGAIVMASDSRASMSRTMVNGNQTIVDNFIHYNDNKAPEKEKKKPKEKTKSKSKAKKK